MKSENIKDIDLVLYHNNVPVGVYKPDYLGLLGIHVTDCPLDYAKGTFLEIEVLGPSKTCVDDNRIPVMVTSSTDNGVGLRLEHYDANYIDRWRKILSNLFHFSQYKESHNNAVAA